MRGMMESVYDETRGDENEKNVIFVRLGHQEEDTRLMLYPRGQAAMGRSVAGALWL